MIKNTLQRYITPILNSYSELFFLQNPAVGIFVLLLTCLDPQAGIAGLIAILSAFAFAQFLNCKEEFLRSGYYTYNPLLVGLSIGHLFTLSPLSILFVSVAAVFTFVITLAMADILHKYMRLPVLSIPFIFISSLIYLASSHYSNLYSSDLRPSLIPDISFLQTLPMPLQGFFECLSGIIFLPNMLVGIAIFLIILFNSRILAFLALTGYLWGAFLQGAFLGSWEQSFHDTAGFNYILIALAIGGVFTIPSWKSYSLAYISIAFATVLTKSMEVFWAKYGIPAFTLPFTVITLCMVYVLAWVRYPLRPIVMKPTPEQTREYFSSSQKRYPQASTLYLPFLDQWSVWQGFDGEWTHQGIWRHAYDFVKKNAQGKTYLGKGNLLADYYCFQKPICSPVSGRVVAVVSHFPDNSIGSVDVLNNWGNYIVIYDARGFYVSLCHLSQYAVYVKAGDWVEPYQVVGLCGNSGYSPQPHLHIQCQTTSFLNSETLPFCFVSLVNQGAFNAHALPENGNLVNPVYVQSFYQQIANFVLDQKFTYDAFYNDKHIDTITFTTKMAIDGTFYLERNDSRLFLGIIGSTFYFYHLEGNDQYLKLLYQALPSMPLANLKNVTWGDYTPRNWLSVWWKKPLQGLLNFIESFNFIIPDSNAVYRFKDDLVVNGEIKTQGENVLLTTIVLDPFIKFSEVSVGLYSLKAKRYHHE